MSRSAKDNASSQSASFSKFALGDLFKPRKNLRAGHLLIIFLVLVTTGIAAEYAPHLRSVPVKRFVLPAIGVLFIFASLVRIAIAVLNRLLLVIRENTAAQKSDLQVIAFSYLSVITGFGTIYLLLESFVGKQVFEFSSYRSYFRIVDYLYVSGVTITGVGDVVPVFSVIKVLVVIESLIGIALTGTVLGLLIGSLLSFNQQDQQRKWYQGIRRLYFENLDKYFQAVNTIDIREQSLADLKAKTFEIRKGILQTIAILVRAQYAPSPYATVSANWMRLHVGSEASQKYLDMAQEYADPQLKGAAMGTVWGILVLREWGVKPPNMPASEQLALPVYDPDDPDKTASQLAGAPAAVASADGYDVVSDTELINLDNQDQVVRTKMEKYFKDHREELRSFASVRIDFRGGTLGVINIQSSEPNLLGATEADQRIIVDMIRPFARYLAQLVVLDEAGAKELTP